MVKGLLWYGVVLSCVILLSGKDILAGNLIKNPGFESDWNEWQTQQEHGHAVGIIDPTVAHSGAKSLRYDGVNKGEKEKMFVTFQTVGPIDLQRSYEFKVWIKAKDLDASVYLQILAFKKDGQPINYIPGKDGANEWFKTEGTSNWSENTQVIDSESFYPETDHIAIYLVLKGATEGLVWFDDVSFEKVLVKGEVL